MDISIEMTDLRTLRPGRERLGRMASASLKRLAAVLDHHGFVAPVIACRSTGVVIDGRQRLLANKLRERPDALVPTIFLDGVTHSDASLLQIALNNPEIQGRMPWETLACRLGEQDRNIEALASMTGLDARWIRTLFVQSQASAVTIKPPATDAQEKQEAPCDAMVILELTDAQYRQHKPTLDSLIASGLSCKVQIAGEPTGKVKE